MNFKALKGMIDSLVKSYKCPECGKEVSENNVDVIGAAGSTVNIDVECPSCGKHSMIKSEVMSLDLTKANMTPDNIQKIKERLGKIGGNIKANIINNNIAEQQVNSSKLIKDSQITELNSELKQEELNVSDLLGDDTNKLD